MMGITARKMLTILICAVIFISLPIAVYFTFLFFMSRMITSDNAGIVFDQFQTALDQGAIIRDGTMAGDIAERSYRDNMKQTPLDGWGKPFRIEGRISGDSCVLTIRSAGPDGAFGTADDVSLERTFDVSSKKSASTHPS